MREGFPVEEALLMKQDDIDRLHVIRQVLDRKLTWPQAAERFTQIFALRWRFPALDAVSFAL